MRKRASAATESDNATKHEARTWVFVNVFLKSCSTFLAGNPNAPVSVRSASIDGTSESTAPARNAAEASASFLHSASKPTATSAEVLNIGRIQRQAGVNSSRTSQTMNPEASTTIHVLV